MQMGFLNIIFADARMAADAARDSRFSSGFDSSQATRYDIDGLASLSKGDCFV